MAEEQAVQTGMICHVELPAPDMAKAKEFYGKLFGWKFEAMNETYEIFIPTSGIGGGLDTDLPVRKGEGGGAGGAILVLTCEEIPAKLEELVAAGGKKLTDKTEIPGDHGFYAYFEDPNGNKMGLWSKV